MLSGFWAFIVLTGMLLLPGWAMLAISGAWRKWNGLRQWIVALGLSIAFYPVLFYVLRAAAPFLTLGPYKMGALLLAAAAVTGWSLRGHWREQFSFDRLEWAAMAVFGMTLFTRFWIIREHPYPAWSDSLHHTLLTQLTAVQGQLGHFVQELPRDPVDPECHQLVCVQVREVGPRGAHEVRRYSVDAERNSVVGVGDAEPQLPHLTNPIGTHAVDTERDCVVGIGHVEAQLRYLSYEVW